MTHKDNIGAGLLAIADALHQRNHLDGIERRLEGLESLLTEQNALLRQLVAKEAHMTVLLDGVRTAVGGLRTAIESLAARLADNPTPEEVAAIASDLNALTAAVDSLDPDVPGGPIDETPA